MKKIGLVGLMGLMGLMGLCGCRDWRTITVEKPVYIHDTTNVTHTEYLFRTDTLINNTETIIREANEGDSALLAKLGIQLKENEKTILVLRSELLEKIQQIEQGRQDSTYQYNERPITVTRTETVEVEKPLKWWKKTFMWIGVIGLAASVVWVLRKLRVI